MCELAEPAVRWDKIPNELKERIVQNSTENTRNALRACSTKDKETVEFSRLKQADMIRFHFHSTDGFTIKTSEQEEQNFATIEEAEQELIRLLTTCHCVKVLGIVLEMVCILLPDRKVRAETIDIWAQSGQQVADILSQLEPHYLRKIELHADYGNFAIYDMPQVVFAEAVSCVFCSIQEQQLIKLDAIFVTLLNIVCPIKNYIEKCAAEAHVRKLEFRFTSRNLQLEGVLIDPNSIDAVYKDYKTSEPGVDLSVINGIRKDEHGFIYLFWQGKTTMTKEWLFRHWQLQPTPLRSLTKLVITVTTAPKLWYIEFKPTNLPIISLPGHNTVKELIESLDEIMAYTGYIKHFEIDLNNETKKFVWTPKKQLTIGTLKITGKKGLTNIIEFLKLIEPGYLRKVYLYTTYKNSDIYDTEQIKKARTVLTCGSFCRDDQLLKLDAPVLITKKEKDNHGLFIGIWHFLTNHSEPRMFNSPITLNLFLKKVLQNLNSNYHAFTLFALDDFENAEGVFLGLHVISTERLPTHTTYMIDSIYPEFILCLAARQTRLGGQRIRRGTNRPTDLI